MVKVSKKNNRFFTGYRLQVTGHKKGGIHFREFRRIP